MRPQRLYAVLYGVPAVASVAFGIAWWIAEGDALLGGFLVLLGVLCAATYRLVTQPARQRARRAAGRAVPPSSGEVPGSPATRAASAPTPGTDGEDQRYGAIVVERPRGYNYAVMRRYRIRIDGQTAGRLRRGETRTFPVRPGPHTVAARIDWSGSPDLTVDVPPGGRVALEVEPSDDPFMGAFTSKKSLTLTRVHDTGSVAPAPRA